jgi:hypothetical protein
MDMGGRTGEETTVWCIDRQIETVIILGYATQGRLSRLYGLHDRRGVVGSFLSPLAAPAPDSIAAIPAAGTNV